MTLVERWKKSWARSGRVRPTKADPDFLALLRCTGINKLNAQVTKYSAERTEFLAKKICFHPFHQAPIERKCKYSLGTFYWFFFNALKRNDLVRFCSFWTKTCLAHRHSFSGVESVQWGHHGVSVGKWWGVHYCMGCQARHWDSLGWIMNISWFMIEH